MIAASYRLRRHADYQRVYRGGRRHGGGQLGFFYRLRIAEIAPGAPLNTPRIGFTVGKALGNAVERNRIKRRLREAMRSRLALLAAPVDVVFHPRREVLTLDFAELEREIESVFRSIQRELARNRRPPSRNDGNMHRVVRS